MSVERGLRIADCGLRIAEGGIFQNSSTRAFYQFFCILFVACAAQAQVSTNAFRAVEGDIRDIRGPIHIPYPWVWIIYVIVGCAVIFLAFQIFRWWKKRRQTVRIKLPHEIALERLEQARAWMNAGHAREFSIAVSDAVRLYIEDCFHERAAHRTTEEFLHNLLTKSSSLLAAHAAPLEDFLRHCDLAKFARWSLSVPEMEAMHASARKFVQETKSENETRNDSRNSDKSRAGGASPLKGDKKAQSPAPPTTPSTLPLITPTRP